jgi:glucose-1-phosphate cytidylyltransferase
MKVVVLCGGQGTRLREETEYRPKPLVEIGGRPILWHIMKIYAQSGFREFVMCLGYRGSMIKQYFLDYEAMTNDFTISLGRMHAIAYHGAHMEQNFTVTLADTGLDTMTGGRVRRVGRYIDGDTFMVTYGDGVADVNVAALVSYHKSHGKLATMTTVRPSSRFGVLDVASDGTITKFAEKPKSDGWINAGFCVFDRRVLDYLDDDHSVLEREPLERLSAERQLVAYKHDGVFFTMDTYREYLMLNEMWAAGDAPWKVWE